MKSTGRTITVEQVKLLIGQRDSLAEEFREEQSRGGHREVVR